MDFNFENCLKEGLSKTPIVPANERKTEEEYFTEAISRDDTVVTIRNNDKLPSFHEPQVTRESNMFKTQLRIKARTYLFERKLSKVLNSNELKTIWSLLQEHHTSLNYSYKQYISYTNFILVKQKLNDKYKLFLSPRIFLQLQHSKFKGYLSIDTFFKYIMKKIWVDQTRSGLSHYDLNGLGYLSEMDFESYVSDLIPTLTQLKELNKIFYSFYACLVVRRFFFYLDPLRTGKIRIVDILSCGFLDELLELREEIHKTKQNYFSIPSALHIYSTYLELDKNHDGLLSISELAGYKSGTLTSVFLDRVFQDTFTLDGQMDYNGFLNFVLAVENCQDHQALRYLFKFFDIKNQGYLDSFVITYFVRAVIEKLPREQQLGVSVQDLKDEIFDMVKPLNPNRITLKDIIHSGMGHTVVNILIDVNGFWSYEFRETAVTDDNLQQQKKI